ncbi:MAG: cupin domain-containing protein [Pseudomonadota bacterium]
MDTRNLLLTATDIERMPGEHKVHFLNPNAVRINKSLSDAVGLSQLGVHMIYVEPGRDTTEFHIHHYEEECVYVISGHGTAIIGTDRYPIGPGDFLGLPRNTVAHNIVNDGDETLVCLVMGQRLAQDVTDYPNQGKRLYRNSGQWNLVDHDAITDPRKK